MSTIEKVNGVSGEKVTITSSSPEEKRESCPCPKCGGESCRFGSSMTSWRCIQCAHAFDRNPSASSRRGHTPGVYDE